MSKAAEPLTRNALFAALFLLVALNAVAGQAVRAVETDGWAAALFTLFGFSAVVPLAIIAGIAILIQDASTSEPTRADRIAAVAVGLAVLIPAAMISKIALTGLAVYAIAVGPSGSALRRAGIVFAALANALAWGRAALSAFSGTLLGADATLVGWMLRAPHEGNMIFSDDRSYRLIVYPACSSMQGISIALLFWATLNQYYGAPLTWRALGWAMAAVAATVAINVVRIGAMLEFPAHFDDIHSGLGWHVAMWSTLAAVIAICLYGARRDVFASR